MSAPATERRTATPEGIAATAEGRQSETNDLNERFNKKISVCKIPANGALVIQRDISVMTALEEIRGDRYAAAVANVRDAVEIYGTKTPEVKKAKCALPAFLFSGRIEGRVKEAINEGRFHHAGLLQLDFDELNDPAAIRDEIAQDPHVLAAWISPSGDGVKGLMIIEPATTADAHLAAFITAEAYWKARGLTLDAACKNSNRLCFASHDPDLQFNNEAVPLATTAAPTRTPSFKVGSKHTSREELTAQDVREMLATIPPRPSYEEWLKIASAVWDAIGEDEGTAALCEWSPEERVGEYAEKYAHRLEKVTAGTLVYIAREHGWKRERTQITTSATSTTLGTRSEPDVKDLLARAYGMAYDPDETPPPDEACMVIGDIAVAARGNLTALQGKSKVGKSAVVSAILGAAQRGQYAVKGDTLRFEWEGLAEGAIIHLDTEQSRADWHGLVTRSIKRAGMPSVSDRLVSLPLVMFARSERLTILQGALAKEAERQGRIDAVIIDGIADLCTSPNDEAESLELVSQIHALAQKYECPIFAILHENPSTDQAKTRGHLGSELNRKAFANLRIDKDTETSISTIFGTDMRKRDIPKEQGFCFAWDDEAGMHLFKGRAAGLKASQKEQKQVAELREVFEPIYEHASNGTKTACPVLSPIEVRDLEQDMNGTEKPVSEAAWKKRMQRAEILGVLRKGDRGKWSFKQTGQTGQKRDKDS
jgi:hypothetical protein